MSQSIVPPPAAGGGETKVNATVLAGQNSPAVAILSNGDAIFTWVSNHDFTVSIYTQRFTAAGTAVGFETRVNTSTDGDQTNPTVVALGDGEYIVAWQGRGPGDPNSGIHMQRATTRPAWRRAARRSSIH